MNKLKKILACMIITLGILYLPEIHANASTVTIDEATFPDSCVRKFAQEKGYVRRTITAALHDAGIREPYPVTSMPEQKRQFIMNIPAEAENTLEEFAWAFGEDTVNEIERRVHIVLEHIHQMPDLEQLAEQGIEELMETWHTLGAIDEDEFLRRMELHMDELPEHMTEEHNRRVVLELIEKRRRHIARQLQQDNPEILEKLKASRVKLEKRLEKQQPEAAKRLRRLEEKLHHK